MIFYYIHLLIHIQPSIKFPSNLLLIKRLYPPPYPEIKGQVSTNITRKYI